ncbi:MAG: DUF302 domain-containing protein [Bacteroidales bacterium]|nr:DUF302 domain-containing protein [Bacteroidales bacterium]
MKAYFSKLMTTGFEETIQIVTEILKEQGFGIITEIDVKETFKKKIDVNFRPYKILGACNPNFAFKALSKDDKVGIMLPCNVIVQQHENGEVEVMIVNPEISVKALKNPALEDFACEVSGVMRKVIARL